MDKYDKIKLLLCYLISSVDQLEFHESPEDIVLCIARDYEELGEMLKDLC
jgi:hypothetical protein